MANIKRRLSDLTIGRLKPPKDGRLEVADEVVPGLVLRITPRGVRSFSVAYKVAGEGGVGPTGRPLCGSQHRITLGRYPYVSLKEARDKARVILESVSMGTDPREKRREEHRVRRGNTVEAVAARFIEQVKPTVETWKRIEQTLALHVLPTLGTRPITDVGRADVHDLLDGIVAGTGAGAAKGVRKHLHRLFEFAMDREIIAANPATKLKRDDLKPNDHARRNLNNDELRSVWAAATELGYPIGPWLRLLMLTGQRRNDWAKAGRSEIDFDRHLLEIPAARYKSRRDHVVPLVGPAWEIVEALPVQEGDYLFSTRAGKGPIAGFSKAKNRLDSLAPLAPYSFHDFRSTCESRLAALGITQEVRDAVLGHAKPGLQRTYNKHDYMDEKRAALELYSGHLMEVVG